jgi:hypothetical protein
VHQQIGEHVEGSGLEVLNPPVEADLAGGYIDGAIVEAEHSTESRVATATGVPQPILRQSPSDRSPLAL